jgi:PAS domain S-box-containing protein
MAIRIVMHPVLPDMDSHVTPPGEANAAEPRRKRRDGGSKRYLGGSKALLIGALIGAFVAALRVGMAVSSAATSVEVAEAFLLVGLFAILAVTAWRASRTKARVEALEQTLMDEHSYKMFIDGALEGFFRTTRDGCYLKANPALATIYGYDSPSQLTSELTDIGKELYVEPARREEFRSLMLRDGKVQNFISQIRRRDGSMIWIAENARAVTDEDGQFLFYEGTVNDITPQRQSEDAMRRALQESEEAAQAKAAFLAAMSHELKTPLNAVIGFSELMLQELFGPVGEPRYRGYIADIRDNGRRLLDMINDILDLTRIEGRLLGLDESEVSLVEVIEEARQSVCADQAELPALTLELQEGLPLLRADPKRVRQIVGHLLSNAVKFTPPGGRVLVRSERTADGGVAIVIEDSGIGMPPERVAMALEPFKQLDGRLARRFGGVGLGLPLANALLRLHGGRLTIDSAPGRGTTVTASFPAARVIAEELRLRA